jgi:Flp pilus assembly protein TadD
VEFQRLGKRISARREYETAARLAPDDPQAVVAAAVGRFDKANPSAAFSRLGPLARRFPRAPTVRFHLGLLLLWMGQVDRAKAELRRAVKIAPAQPLAKEAKRFLARLETVENG